MTSDQPFDARRATLLVITGSVLIAWSGIFVGLADLPPASSAFLRNAYAAPLLALIAWHWHRTGRAERLTRAQVRWSVLAGVCFGADLVLWHVCIDAVGAGLATVLGNTQVVLFPLGAWLVWRERPTQRQAAALPVLLVGIVLISGAIGAGAYGEDPLLGVITGVLTGVAYAGFLVGMRGAAPANGALPVTALTIATTIAAIFAMLCALAMGVFDPVPAWPALGWMLLLAFACQVVAWLLITGSIARVTAARLSILLLIQPVTALALGVVVLAEEPSSAQMIGALLVLVGVLFGARQ